MLLDKTKIIIENSQSIITFETGGEGNGVFPFWDRYIAIDGKKSYRIGVYCGSCIFFFERLEELDEKAYAKIIARGQDVAAKLNNGVSTLDQGLIDTLKMIMPNGSYEVLLCTITPKLVHPGQRGDFFIEEQADFIRLNETNDPKTEYYRGHKAISILFDNYKCGFFEFLIPLFSSNFLKKERVDFYKDIFMHEKMPTALALSVLETHYPECSRRNEAPVKSHFCLTHYLIDGHHKAYAAALLGKPLTIISFLALEKGKAGEYETQKCIDLMQTLSL
jgi:hypothetical protein